MRAGLTDVVRDRGVVRAERCFALFLVFGHVYYYHRWAFQYGDESTSPTYTSTPLNWQAAKYVVVALMIVVVAVMLLRSRRAAADAGGFAWIVGLVLVLCAVITMVNAARANGAAVEGQIADWWFLPLVLAMPFFWRQQRSIDLLLRVGTVLVIYHVVFEAYQVFSYLAYDRLPALAYPGGLVRFGGGLDDPNGFGLILVLPILVTLALWPSSRRIRSAASFTALLTMLVLTLSYSAFAALIVGLPVFFFVARDLGRGLVVAVVVGAGSVGIVFTDWFQSAIADKQESALSRFATSWTKSGEYAVSDYFPRADALEVLLGVPYLDVHSENSYFVLLSDYGIVVPIVVGLAAVLTVGRGGRRAGAQRAAGDERAARITAAFTAYVAAFAVASLGVPSLNVFPVNVTFWAVAMALWLPTTEVDGYHAESGQDSRGLATRKIGRSTIQ